MAVRAKGADLLLPIAVVAMVAMMMFPLPSVLLDTLLIFNITFSLTLLLSAVYVSEPERFTALPTVLLFSTLFRLGLNISTTRQLLSTGQAPDTVVTFGNFLVNGNLVVGAVVFAIITLVQFLVIAKGSERVAEVAARFTLDAMPGKQMSIDADIRAGLLSVVEGKQKRLALQRESKLYGALDGAMKFVKGDAIAGLCITIVNALGGLAIGMTQLGMSASEALSRYTLFTIGDGLISQIPALLVAIAAGVIVTRVSEDESSLVGRELFNQLAREPQALATAALVTLAMACVPGLPALPFVGFAIVLGVVALDRRQKQDASERRVGEEGFRPRLYSDLLLRLSPSAILHLQKLGTFADEVQSLRARIFEQRGLIIPDVQFEIDTTEATLAGHVEFRGMLLERVPGDGLEPMEYARSVLAALARHAEALRCEFCDDASTRQLLEVHRVTSEELINSTVPELLSVTELTSILRQLIREDVSIRDFRVILQAIAEHSVAVERGVLGTNEFSTRMQLTHDAVRELSARPIDPTRMQTAELLASVRVALKRTISRMVCDEAGCVYCGVLDPQFDAEYVQAEVAGLPIDPARSDWVRRAVEELARQRIGIPTLVASRFARMRMVRMVAAEGVLCHVVAPEELLPEVSLVVIGTVSELAEQSAELNAGEGGIELGTFEGENYGSHVQ